MSCANAPSGRGDLMATMVLGRFFVVIGIVRRQNVGASLVYFIAGETPAFPPSPGVRRLVFGRRRGMLF